MLTAPLSGPPSEAIHAWVVTRLLTLLIGIALPQFAVLARAEPATDRPFFVRWADWADPVDSGDFDGVHFANADTGWVVGEGGTILATHDGGTQGEPQNSGTDNHLLGLHFTDRGRVAWDDLDNALAIAREVEV